MTIFCVWPHTFDSRRQVGAKYPATVSGVGYISYLCLYIVNYPVTISAVGYISCSSSCITIDAAVNNKLSRVYTS